MGSREKYQLQLIAFKETILANWQKLRNADKFCDVTLVCDDGTKVKGHKVILASVSPVFHKMLSNENPHQQILLYLRGVKYSQIVYLLDFIYNGEVKICQDELNDFVLVARDLQIKGIAEEYENEKETDEESKDVENLSSSSFNPPHKKKRRGDIKEDKIEIKDLKAFTEPVETRKKSCAEIDENNKNTINNANQSMNLVEVPISIKEEPTNIDENNGFFHEGKIEKGFSYEGKINRENTLSHACDRCNYQTIIKGHLIQHIKSIHEGVRYPCENCEYKATTKSALNHHVKAIHEGIKYNCEECDLQTGIKNYLVQHIARIHDRSLYSCTQCDDAIKGKYKFDQHMKTKHRQFKIDQLV